MRPPVYTTLQRHHGYHGRRHTRQHARDQQSPVKDPLPRCVEISKEAHVKKRGVNEGQRHGADAPDNAGEAVETTPGNLDCFGLRNGNQAAGRRAASWREGQLKYSPLLFALCERANDAVCCQDACACPCATEYLSMSLMPLRIVERQPREHDNHECLPFSSQEGSTAASSSYLCFGSRLSLEDE